MDMFTLRTFVRELTTEIHRKDSEFKTRNATPSQVRVHAVRLFDYLSKREMSEVVQATCDDMRGLRRYDY